ncbi:hypothetical protein SLS57_008999 [Botryosphaeria dothidea]
MAAADVMRLDAAPTRRQDIISQILSDYGDSRDADEDDVDLDDYYTQAEMSPAPPPAAAPPVQSAPVSPVGKDKPLPPLLGFQLRDLKLARSNGSTALTAGSAATPAKTDTSSPLPSLTLSAPNLLHQPTPDRARAQQSARLLNELPLPPTPPQPPAKTDLRRPSDPSTTAAGAATMGNKASKAADDQHSPSHRSKFSLRRKPVKKDASPPAHQANGAPVAPPQGHVTPVTQAGAAQAHPRAPASPLAVQNSKPNAPPQQSITVPQPSAPQSEGNTLVEPNRTSQSISTTLSDATIVRDRSNSPPTEPDDEEPITPTLKPAAVDLLPSPSPVPEESPSKYGVVKQPSNSTMKEQKVAMHYRGKSSTGFDIFKSLEGFIQERMGEKTVDEKTSNDAGTIRNKENLMVKKTRRSAHEPNKVIVWEA